MTEIPHKSKAAVIAAYNQPYQIREFPVPEVVPGAVLVRVEMAGVCGTDVHQWQGDIGIKPALPVIPGHESVGRVIKLGDGGKKDCTGESVNVGDRIMWPHVSCGKCYSCVVNHQPNLCENRFSYGFSSSADFPYLTGGFAEYEYVIPGADVIRIPPELSNEEVIGVCCAFRTAVAAYERLGAIGVQSSFVIQGCGPVGLYYTLLAVAGGASQVIVVGAPDLRLGLAAKWGAASTINIENVPDAGERRAMVLELTGGRGPDVVVEASGVPAAFREGMDIVRRGGKYLIVGQTSMGEQAVVPGLITLKHLEIIGNASATIRHYHQAIQFIKNKRHRYSFADIVTNHYRLDQVNEAVRAMMTGREIKPVIVP
jgi:L-iditol 2-dehydrogenase